MQKYGMGSPRAIGVDIVEISRIRAIHRRHGKKFFDRMLTRTEQSYCLTKSDPYPSISGRVAAKEAVAKAMGVGIGGSLRWVSISVENTHLGAPKIVLDSAGKKSLKKLGGKEILLSISHTADIAIATAIVR